MSNLDYSGLKKAGTHAILEDGNVVTHVENNTVYVSSSNDLEALTDFPAGTIAIKYGFANVWQKKPDGTWASVS
jgi:hypothetical protein